MNGYERIVAALELEEPDRIPIMEWLVDAKVIDGLCPGADLFGFVEQMDLDGIAVGGTQLPKHNDTLETTYVDNWGVRWGRTAEAFAPLDGPIDSLADLETYEPPSPCDDALLADLRKAVERFKGERFIVYMTGAEFSCALRLRGMAEFLMDLIDDPELAHGVLRLSSDFYSTLARRAIEAGADAIMFGDDWAHNTGPFMSPAQFRRFILPHFKRAVRTVKEAGGYVFKHSDGNIWSILDMTMNAGIDAINPIQPDAGMDIGEVKRKHGHRVCVSGNIDCGHTLSEAPVEQVAREVKEAIRDAGPGGGYIMMSSNSLHSSVRPENYKVMVETTRAHGKYPLDMAALS